jgi:hypothetical protein
VISADEIAGRQDRQQSPLGPTRCLAAVALVAGATVAIAAGAAGGRAAGLPPGTQFSAFAASVLTEPQAVRGTDGFFHLAYELILTNTRPLKVRLGRVEVLDARTQRVLRSLGGRRLVDAMSPVGGPAIDEGLPEPRSSAGPVVRSSASVVVWLDVRVRARSRVPRELVHRLAASTLAAPNRPVRRFTEVLARVPTSPRSPVALGPPVRDGPWLVSESCCANDTHHRRGLAAFNGVLLVPQRFAIDWFRLDADHQAWVGDPADVHSYLAFGQPVLASAAGTVVDVQDGVPDQHPPKPPVPPPIEDTVGNHITIEIGAGLYLLYAHLTPGSVRVRLGQRVRRGQTLGLIGTSGNSTTPHLHFQVMTTPAFFPTDSPPFVFDLFDLVGQVTKRIWDDDIGLQPTGALPYRAARPAGRRHLEMPLDRNVIVFPRA